MPQIVKPQTKVKVVPREGELEVTVNINITVDGQVTALAQGGSVSVAKEDEEDKVDMMIPDFISGAKLNFGKSKEDK